MARPSTLSVVVPAFNAPDNLRRCLEALAASTVEHQLIVVDDCSDDPTTIAMAEAAGAERGAYVRLERNSGPGAARNAGVERASGELVLFIDSDVLVRPDTLALVLERFEREPSIAALFGSYDDAPDSPGFVTEYRNLLHHYVHQTGPSEATTFWAGCGAVRREVFRAVGGYDAKRYPKPQIEDIELGMRLVAAGHSIRLCPELQVKHLKRWRFVEMVRVDVTCRAIPWTRLLIERPGTGGDLNLEAGQKLCVALAFLAVGALATVPFLGTWAVVAAIALWLPIFAINRGLYAVFLRRRGPLFAAVSMSLHFLYFLYGGAAFLWAHATARLRPAAVTALLALVATVAACGDPSAEPEPASTPARVEEPPGTGDPRRETHDALKAAQTQTFDPSDGAGRAWLELDEGDDGSVVASGAGRWSFVFEAGELGIADGGALYLQVSPFWNWSTPQPDVPDAPGYTTATTEAEGVELVPRTLDAQLLEVAVTGRALAAGEQVRIVYGAGPAMARADSYAEQNSRFWFAVDGDGDGVRRVLDDSPGVEVLPGRAERLVVTLPTIARPGELVRATVALLDRAANAGVEYTGTIELVGPTEGHDLPESIELVAEDAGRRTFEFTVHESGLYHIAARARIGGEGGTTIDALSNPLLVSAGGPRVFWADFHGHSEVSDGTGTPEDYYTYARDVAALDIVALTDHDHWGMRFMDEHPELWEANHEVTRRFHEPGRFVTLFGYEWTNWIYGHRHVLYFSEDAPLLSSMDERYETPQQLWEALAGKAALTVPHHPAGGPIGIDWGVAPDPLLDPVCEVISAHGCSEAYDCPRLIHRPRPGHFARDALELGYSMGFMGSGDSHDGHPGFTHLGPHYPTGGVAAVLADELTREGVLAALREHRVYATSGPRILLRVALGTTRMGGRVDQGALDPEAGLFIQAIGTAPLEVVEVVRSGALYEPLPGDGRSDFTGTLTIDDLQAGEYVYVRVVQTDGGMAWSSPIYVD